MSLEKAGWTLTFYDEFDFPQRSGIYWYPAYRSWRVEYLNRCRFEQRGFDHNAHYVIEDSLTKLRITETFLAVPNRAISAQPALRLRITGSAPCRTSAVY